MRPSRIFVEGRIPTTGASSPLIWERSGVSGNPFIGPGPIEVISIDAGTVRIFGIRGSTVNDLSPFEEEVTTGGPAVSILGGADVFRVNGMEIQRPGGDENLNAVTARRDIANEVCVIGQKRGRSGTAAWTVEPGDGRFVVERLSASTTASTTGRCSVTWWTRKIDETWHALLTQSLSGGSSTVTTPVNLYLPEGMEIKASNSFVSGTQSITAAFEVKR